MLFQRTWGNSQAGKGRNNLLIGLTNLQKENYQNRDKSKNTKHLIFRIRFYFKGRQFTKLINKSLISVVSNDKLLKLYMYNSF